MEEADILKVARARHMTFPLLKSDDAVTTAYGAGEIPQTYLLDKSGQVLQHVTGEPSPSAAKFWPPLIEKALRAKS